METRLQSNEVRIPKPEFDLKTSFTGSDHLNSSTGSSGSGGAQHYFKSSFARSLSTFGASPQSQSLDFTINYGYPQTRFSSSIDEEQTGYGNAATHENSPLSMPPMYSCGAMQEDEGQGTGSIEKPVTEQSTESLVSSSSVATVKNVWNGNAQVCRLFASPFLCYSHKPNRKFTRVQTTTRQTDIQTPVTCACDVLYVHSWVVDSRRVSCMCNAVWERRRTVLKVNLLRAFWSNSDVPYLGSSPLTLCRCKRRPAIIVTDYTRCR